jgi:hypothetical protein
VKWNGDEQAEQHASDNLYRATHDDDATELSQLSDREIDSQRKHEERHTDLCQHPDRLGLKYGSGGKRSDQNPGKQVADDRRLTEALRDEAACESSGPGQCKLEN